MSYYLDDEIPNLETALGSLTVEDLKKLAALTGEKVPIRKDALVAVIVNYLAGDRLRKVWDGLDELQQAAVAEAVYSPFSRFEAGFFRAKYGREPDWGRSTESAYRREPSALCLFFFRDRLIPEDLRARLLEFVPEPRETALETLDQLPPVHPRPFARWNVEKRTREEGTEDVPLTVHQTEQAAQRELLAILRLVDAGKVSVSEATRRPSAATVQAIIAMLDDGEYYEYVPPNNKWNDQNAGPIRSFAWPLLIQAGGFAQLSGTRLHLTKNGRRALSEPAAASLFTLWNKWVGTTIFDELTRVEAVKGQTGKGKRGLTAPSDRRAGIALSLKECPPEKWVAIEEFSRYMKATGSEFSVTRDPWRLYIGEQQYGSLGYDGGAELVNHRYMLGLLLEYAATLGMIDVALIPPAGARRDFHNFWGTDDLPFFSRYDGLIYFRLTRLGAYCLGAATAYQPAPLEVKPVLRFLPNLVIESDPEIEKSDFLALNSYAMPVSDFVWRLEPGQLLAAIEAGRQAEEISAFLEARCGAALPEEAMRLFDDLAERITSVYDRGPARLIECADPALAARIAREFPTRKHCLQAGDRHLVVSASAEAAFRRTLQEVGYLLNVDGKRPVKRRKSAQAARQ